MHFEHFVVEHFVEHFEHFEHIGRERERSYSGAHRTTRSVVSLLENSVYTVRSSGTNPIIFCSTVLMIFENDVLYLLVLQCKENKK